MKSTSAVPFRCSHLTVGGRQCRQLSTDPRSGLCSQHLQKQNEHSDLTQPLLTDWQGFQTAQGLNYSLSNLYKLLAANRISTRRASVLAYINSLLLRTLPAIDADQAAGIKVPAAYREATGKPSGAVDAKTAAGAMETELVETGEPVKSDPAAAKTAGTGTSGNDTADWPDSIPEPDTTKKPS